MTIEELVELVPEDRREDATVLIEAIKTEANPLAGLDESNAEKVIEGTPLLKSARDRFLQNGLKTWQENNLDKLYAQRYAKDHPEETEEQKRLKALEISIAEERRLRTLAENKVLAQRLLADSGIDVPDIDYVVGEDVETTTARIEWLKGVVGKHGAKTSEEVRKSILDEYGRAPDKPVTDGVGKYFTIAQMESMSAAEQDKNRELFDASIRYHEKQQR